MIDSFIDAILRHPKRSTLVTAIVVIVLGTTAWWYLIWENPQQVFYGMLANNLATPSVTRVASASSSNQGVKQLVRLDMGGTNAADWLVTAEENGASVTSDSIGTPGTGYVRYVKISTASKAKSGKPLDFNTVLNVWAKSDGKTDTTLNQLFSNTILDVNNAPIPPIGDLPAAEQQNISAYMQNQNVYAPSYKKVKRQKVNGQEVYTYSVSVRLGPYIRMMQAFAHDLNNHTLDSINPDQYSATAPVTMTMSVAIASHQLVRITYPETSFSQSYTDWGLLPSITVPHATLTTTQLQDRISALSNVSS